MNKNSNMSTQKELSNKPNNTVSDDDDIVIIADYKFDATRIGDYTGSFIEHWCFGCSAHYIRSFSIQYMKEFMPLPARDGYLYGQEVKLNTESIVGMGALPMVPGSVKSHIKSDGNAYFNKKDSYRFSVIPMFSLTNEGNKKAWQEWSDKVFFNSPQKCTDDTKFAEDMTLTYLEHDDVYQLSNDDTNYKFVSPNKNFANKSSTKNNFEHDYMYKILSRYDSDVYAHNEYGLGAGQQLEAMKSCVKKKNVNLSQEISAYKEASRKEGGYAGRSYGNGSVMRVGPNIFVAQGFKQGLELTKISVQNTHDCDHSIKSAQAVATVGFCANYGLRRETILKIIHFLYYDPSPLKTQADRAQIGGDRDCFLKCGELDFCNFDMLSHREGKVSENTTPQDLQAIDEEDAKNYIEHNEFTEKCFPVAMLAIKICLTSKCAEEAMSKILRAAGDCDTIGATAIPMVAALFGLPKKWVDRIYEISMCKDKTAAMNKMTNKKQTHANTKHKGYQDNPKDIKVFDEKGYFIEHNEISRMANEKFKHHYREYAPIEWQLKNICELMNYLEEHKSKSNVNNKDQLLNEIFSDIKSDIDFMLDKEQKYELEELSQDVKGTLSNMEEITKEEIKDDKKLEQKLRQEDAKYKAKINKHRNATAKFQTKMKNQKLDNLTKENIDHISEEIKAINSIFKEHKLSEVSVKHLKAKVISSTIHNNNAAPIPSLHTGSKDNQHEKAEFEKPKNPNVEFLSKNGSVVKKIDNSLANTSEDNKNEKAQFEKPQNPDVNISNNNKNATPKSGSLLNDKNKKEVTVVIAENHPNNRDSGESGDRNQLNNNSTQKPIQNNDNRELKDDENKNSQVIEEINSSSDDESTKEKFTFTKKQDESKNRTNTVNGNSMNKSSKNESEKKNDIVVATEKQDEAKKEATEQNEVNHKFFALSSFVLMVADILLLIFNSSLTIFPAAVGASGLVVLLGIWAYKAFSSRTQKSANIISPGTEEKNAPLITEHLNKNAGIDNSGPFPLRENSNDQKDK